MVFELLDERIRKVLTDKQISMPTGPQTEAIPHILAGRNILLVAPTGIGKTEAAMLPIFHKLISTEGKGIRCIYVTPLRALNRDMLRRLEEFGDALDLRVAVRHGDTPQSERTHQSKYAPDVLIDDARNAADHVHGKEPEAAPDERQVLCRRRDTRTGERRARGAALHSDGAPGPPGRGFPEDRPVRHRRQHTGGRELPGRVIAAGHDRQGPDRQGDDACRVQYPEVTDEDRDLAGTLQSDAQLTACMRRCRKMIEEPPFNAALREHPGHGRSAGRPIPRLGREVPGGRAPRLALEGDPHRDGGELQGGEAERADLHLLAGDGHRHRVADYAIQYNSPRQVARLIQRMGRAGHQVGAYSEGAMVASSPDEITGIAWSSPGRR